MKKSRVGQKGGDDIILAQTLEDLKDGYKEIQARCLCHRGVEKERGESFENLKEV